MIVNCKHWEDCGVVNGGCCAIKEYHKPSVGVCLLICKKKTQKTTPEEIAEIEKPKSKKANIGCSNCGAKGLKRLLQGSAALLKAELGIDAADDATIENRKAICLACGTYDFGVCNDCGCFCAAKVKLKTGSPCPQGKW